MPGVGTSASSSAGLTASASPFRADPAKVPGTRSQAARLASDVVLEPHEWGGDFTRQNPATSPPGTVAVLDDQCRWQRRTLPTGVLASMTRYSEIPATGGKGTLKVSAGVTVHATVRDADQLLATTLEEPLRCREQQVRAGERITGLMSAGTSYGSGRNTYADDQVVELGSHVTGRTRQTYHWYVTRLGTVTMAVSVRGAKGYSDDELNRYASRAQVSMINSVEFELGGDR
ncbi:hypothetical protein ACGFS9_19785 [Streptomyces sp. NPDC048566]|uniref:hypothetical protein n=1 Tax=Streptomyces sp. NPDC048566 TaxID=3365569 RepID=UPI003718DE99